MKYILLILVTLVNFGLGASAFGQFPLYIIDPRDDSYNIDPLTTCSGTAITLKTPEGAYWKGITVSLYQSTDNINWGAPIQAQTVEKNLDDGNTGRFTFTVTPTETAYYRVVYSLGGISESVKVTFNPAASPAPSVVTSSQSCSAVTLLTSGHDAGYTWYCQRYLSNGNPLGFTEMAGETGPMITTSAQNFDYDYRLAYTDPGTGCSAGSNIINVNNYGIYPYLCATDATVTINETYTISNLSLASCAIRDGCNKLVGHFFNTSSGTASVKAKIAFDESVQSYSGQAYAQRHFDFAPLSPLFGSSLLTLYYTQAEFDAFNAVSTVSFPHSPSDPEGYKAAIRVLQASGIPKASTSGPGNYTGGTSLIVPLDVSWNTTLKCWSITVSVTDLSGFFLTAPQGAMPVTLHSIAAQSDNEAITLTWTTSSETLFKQYEIERSTDPKAGFDYLATVNPKGDASGGNYAYRDQTVQAGIDYYYRLKMVDLDGSNAYSRFVTATLNRQGSIRIFPNPTHKALTISCVEPITSYRLLGMLGFTQLTQTGLNTSQIDLTLPDLPTGLYVLQITTKSGLTENRKLVVN